MHSESFLAKLKSDQEIENCHWYYKDEGCYQKQEVYKYVENSMQT